MDERIGLFEALYTCRAIRRFRPDPIPDSVLSKVIESATRASNGSNRQRWRFVVIRDPGLRRQVGEVYRRAMNDLVPAEDAAKDMEILGRRLFQASWYLAEHIGTEPPVLILVCQQGSSPPTRPADALLATRSRGASAYPAVQNLLLAARACGLSGCPTNGPRDPRRGDQGNLGYSRTGQHVRAGPAGISPRPIWPRASQGGRRRHTSQSMGRAVCRARVNIEHKRRASRDNRLVRAHHHALSFVRTAARA